MTRAYIDVCVCVCARARGRWQGRNVFSYYNRMCYRTKNRMCSLTIIMAGDKGGHADGVCQGYIYDMYPPPHMKCILPPHMTGDKGGHADGVCQGSSGIP